MPKIVTGSSNVRSPGVPSSRTMSKFVIYRWPSAFQTLEQMQKEFMLEHRTPMLTVCLQYVYKEIKRETDYFIPNNVLEYKLTDLNQNSHHQMGFLSE